MTLYDELKAGGFINRYGLVTNEPNDDSCGNGTLFTAQANLLEPDERYVVAVAGCAGWLDRGIYRRWPSSWELNSPDNWIGGAACSQSLAFILRRYGRERGWLVLDPAQLGVWRLLHPLWTWDRWLGRQPGTVGFIKARAGLKPNWFEKLAFNIGALITIWSRKRDAQGRLETSDRMLLLTMLRTQEGFDMLWGWVRTQFYANVDGYFGSQNDMVKVYFGNPNHPFRKAWEDELFLS